MTWVSGHPQKLWDSSWTPPNLRHLWFIAFIVDICAQRNRTQQQWQRITCKLRRCNAASDKCTQHVQNFVTYLQFGVNKLQWRTDQRYYSPDYNIFDTDGQYRRYCSPGHWSHMIHIYHTTANRRNFHLRIIISMQMTLNFSYHSLLLTLHTISLILNKLGLYLMSTVGYHLTFFLSIPLRLSFFLWVFLNNSQNSVILSFIYLIMSLCHLLILLVI